MTAHDTISSSSPATSNSDPLHTLLECASQPLLAVDAFGTTLIANRVARQLLRCDPGTHLKSSIPEIWPRVSAVLQYGLPHADVPVRVGDHPFSARIEPVLTDGETTGAVCVFRDDATPREVADKMQAYHDLTRELNAIIDSSSEGLCICDDRGTVLRINRTSARFYNMNASEIVGRSVVDLEKAGLIDRSAAKEVIQSGKVCNLFQQRGARKLMVTAMPVYDGTGALARVVVSERDITEIDELRHELEEEQAMKDRLRLQMLDLQKVSVKGRQLIAKTPCMVKVLSQAIRVSGVNSTVLVLGESGVGKGVIAELIHKNSSRSEKPLIKINCGAIPETLVESELFGYEKGAFTGAQGSKPGYLEMADGGILFLDEIAELPLSSQVKLLRFLEDGEIMRLGGTKPKRVDVRIIAATHRDLQAMVEQGKFRFDLFYRLNVIPIQVPALRDRKDCLLPMIRHYMKQFGEQAKVQKRLSRAATDALLAYGYPGNVRELMNLCERLVVMSEGETIDLPDLPSHLVSRPGPGKAATVEAWPAQMSLDQIMESVERELLVQGVQRHRNQARLAEALGVNQSTVTRKLRRYGIR